MFLMKKNMSFFEDINSIKLLQNLLKKPEDSESDEDLPTGSQSTGPGNIGVKKKPSSKTTDTDNINKLAIKLEEQVKIQPKNLDEWLEAEVQENKDILDNRKRPNYSVSYKQAVKTEDIYLQMGCKTPSTASCEDMILNIKLPDEQCSIEAMTLTVHQSEIDVQTPIYRLKMPLYQPVDPDKGKAEYNSDKRILKLTLRMHRELDFINF